MTENNISISVKTHFLLSENVGIQLVTGYLRKIIFIYSLKDYNLTLQDGLPILSFLIYHKWNNLSVDFFVGSYDVFYYPDFLSPVFELGISYQINDKFSINLQSSLSYSDFFTLTGYIDCVIINTALTYYF